MPPLNNYVSGPNLAGLIAAFGTKPNIPDPSATQGQAIQGDISNLGSLYGLAGSVNQFQNSQAPLGLQQNLPGYQDLLGKASSNAQSLLSGQVPQDVINQLTQSAAERGIAMGSPGSPNANSALLSALGQTSLGLEQQGLQNFQTLEGMTPQAAPMDLSRFMVTPQQQQDVATQQAISRAAPDPASSALTGLGAAQAGVNAGRAGGAAAPAMPTMPTMPAMPSGGGLSLPGGSGLGLTYGGIAYPPGQSPSFGGPQYFPQYGAPSQHQQQGQYGQGDMYDPYQNMTQTGAGMLGTAGVPLTGDPLIDTLYSSSGYTGDPFLDDLYSQYNEMYGGQGGQGGQGQGTFYAGPAQGAPADQQGGGYTYMGPNPAESDPYSDWSNPDQFDSVGVGTYDPGYFDDWGWE